MCPLTSLHNTLWNAVTFKTAFIYAIEFSSNIKFILTTVIKIWPCKMLKERGSFQWENEKTSLGMASIKPGTPTAKRKQPLAMEVKEKEAREREKEKDSTQKQ